jgi:hypothetical protein
MEKRFARVMLQVRLWLFKPSIEMRSRRIYRAVVFASSLPSSFYSSLTAPLIFKAQRSFNVNVVSSSFCGYQSLFSAMPVIGLKTSSAKAIQSVNTRAQRVAKKGKHSQMTM